MKRESKSESESERLGKFATPVPFSFCATTVQQLKKGVEKIN